MRRETGRVLLATAALLVFAALFFWRLLANENPKNYGFASADLFLFYYPIYAETYARVRAGILPRWNPWQLCGTPWLAALQAGLYYPGHLVYLVLPTRLGMAWSGIAHLFLAAIGTYAFARRAGLGHLGALAAGAAFGFRGSIVECLNGPNVQEAAAWIGVGALGAIEVAERRHARAIATLGAATTLSLLAGYPQLTLYLVYTWGSLWLVWTLAHERSPAALLAGGGAFAAALAAGTFAAAAQLLPTVELFRAASRGPTALPTEAISPLGNSAADLLANAPVVGRPASFTVVLLVLAGVATVRGRHRTLGWWALGTVLLAALFSLGTTMPWFRFVQMLPGMALFRGPHRALLIVDFGLAIAAGVALDGLTRERVVPRTSLRAAVDWAPLVGALGLTLTYVHAGTAGAIPVLVGLVAGAAAQSTLALGHGSRGLAAIVLALLAWTLLTHEDFHLVFPYAAERVAWFERYDPTYRALAAADPHGRTWVLRTLDPPLAVKHATRHHMRAFEDYEPVNFRRQNEYLTFFGEGVVTDFVNGATFIGNVPRGMTPGADGTSPGTRRRLLDLAAVDRIVMTPEAAHRAPTELFLQTAGLAASTALGPFTIAPNPHALPRAYVVHRTAPAPPLADLLTRLADPSFDALALAYVEGDPGFVADANAPARGETARFIEDGEDVVEVETATTAPGLLVLADTYATGWRATVDGHVVAIVPTNHLFRGVAVASGTHRVRFTYRPWTIPVGQMLSLVGCALLGALACRARLARTPE